MARVMIRGFVVYRKVNPPRDEASGSQVSVAIVDGQRYSLYVPLDDPMAAVKVGQLVEVVGELRQRDQYLNVVDAELKAIGEVTWHPVG